MKPYVAHRLNAISDCCNGIGAAVAMLLSNVIRLPFAIVFGWPDPIEQARHAQTLLHLQMTDLEAKAEAKAREAMSDASDE